MAMLAFYQFEKSKNQFQLIRHFIHNTTLVLIMDYYELFIMGGGLSCCNCCVYRILPFPGLVENDK
jgi:hypothetical protein